MSRRVRVVQADRLAHGFQGAICVTKFIADHCQVVPRLCRRIVDGHRTLVTPLRQAWERVCLIDHPKLDPPPCFVRPAIEFGYGASDQFGNRAVDCLQVCRERTLGVRIGLDRGQRQVT